ncbi:MAG TPA: hypothetical protein VKY74_06490 [Chloroflexia bacterium]|nr:hypothetical protein [Chloroflexia bacterium]
MSNWVRIADDCWRKESAIPAGLVIAEIHKQGDMPLYSTRVEVSFTEPRLPHHISKNSIGLRSLPEAEATCNALVAGIIAAETLAPH